MEYQPLPIGIDDFGELIAKNYCYVDKTLLIKELLDLKGKVNLFTRPRRFGKTLNMSMLRYFFEDTNDTGKNAENRRLFAGLGIMEQGERYTGEMGRYPVISISLKSGKQSSFASAYFKICEELVGEFDRHREIVPKLSPEKAARYQSILDRSADEDVFSGALRFLSEALWEAGGKRVLILIDEYDVPLENAYFSGFYEKMIAFIRSLFESALKTNPYLEFSVITGCLRVTKESIFTGLNNLKMISILSESYDEYFGFVQSEVDEILKKYNRWESREVIKSWYDGYRFGNEEVYNPWSVMNYVESLSINPQALPVPYWANTSSNSIVKTLVEQSGLSVRKEIETLIAGGTIEKPVHEEITYEDVDRSEDNLWNFLFFTGYLKMTGKRMEGVNRVVTMTIPNLEVSYIYQNTVLDWFDRVTRGKDLSRLYRAIEQGDTETMAEAISENLRETISFYDYGESYYHGFLAGLLKNTDRYYLLSNRETGTGRADLLLKSPSVKGLAVVMELKAVKKYSEMEKGCLEAIRQLREKDYAAALRDEGYSNILQYGICFYQKECMVQADRQP